MICLKTVVESFLYSRSPEADAALELGATLRGLVVVPVVRTKCRGFMLAPYIYDTDSVQEHLLCRAEANNTASESTNRMHETAEVSNHSDLEAHDLDAMMQEPPSPKGRL
uniref:Uncharacterized protein n=1 Tax=Fusarium oxysporum (strain Fo5176) TaxID=660025 RepID=A0A0D2YC03_FUSOF